MRGRTGGPGLIAAPEDEPIASVDEQIADAVAAFRAAVLGHRCRLVRNEGHWLAEIGSARIQLCARWRLLGPLGLVVAVEDDGQMFGRSHPVDAEKDANAALKTTEAIDLTITPLAGDLLIMFDSKTRLDGLVDSSGYESWVAEFTQGGCGYTLVCNGGKLSTHKAPEGRKPQTMFLSAWRPA